jgi:hypothetical protein
MDVGRSILGLIDFGLVGVLYFLVPLLFVWAIVGAIIFAVHLWGTPPPPPPNTPPNCRLCAQWQAVWDSMGNFERAMASAYYLALSAVCIAMGCTLIMSWD